MKECPPGKELNPKTNRCVKVKPVKECPPGKVMNLATGRCVKEKSAKQRIKMPELVREDTDFSRTQINEMVDKYINIGKTEEMTQKYGGYIFFHDLYILYLLKKYRYTCYSISGARLANGVIVTPVIYTDPKLAPSDEEKMDFVDITFRCIVEKKNEVVVIPVIVSESIESRETHFNVLIYRRKEHQIELFEPHGAMYQKDFDKSEVIWRHLDRYIEALNKMLADDFGMEPVKFLSSPEICPVLDGMQVREEQGRPLLILKKKKTRTEYEPGGFCTIWGLFFIELVLKNPHVPSKDLIMGVLDKVSATDMVNIARGYMITVCNKLQQYYSAIMGRKVNTTTVIASYLFNDGDDHLTQRAINGALTQIVETERHLEIINMGTTVTDKLYKEHVEHQINALKKMVDHPEKFSELDARIQKYLYNYYTNQHTFVTPTVPEVLKVCPPGKLLNPKTKRCKTVKIKTCPPGKVMNPKTKRCNKIRTVKQ
jgi:hypothetical protein